MKLKTLYILLFSLLAPLAAGAQQIVSVNVDTMACLGDTIPVSIGFLPQRNIVLQNGVATLGSFENAFLPDGVICDGKCSYESPVVFTDFTPGTTITSVSDIKYIRLKIEHSFLGDIYMGIKCPNGQRASLMNWSSTGHSSCTDSVPASHRGWNNAYPNVGGGTYLGQPVDLEDGSDKCDSTLENNRAGIGWNYCWSEDTSMGYQYANEDALIYRQSNRIYVNTRSTVDSSNVAAGTNFYRPDQNFSNLVGCPLNGQWTIEVIDAYSQDNGYIFEWELALDPMLLPMHQLIVGQEVIGDDVTAYTDSTYGVSAPGIATSDTTVSYLVNIYTSLGDTIDTTFNVHYFAPDFTYIDDTLCDGDTAWWLGQAYTSDTLIYKHLANIHGCDSIISVHYTFNPVYEVDDTLRYCERDTFWYEGVDYGGPSVFDAPHLSVDRCDSTVHVVLELLDSLFNPHMLLSDDDSLWSGDTTLHGCNPYLVYAKDTSLHTGSRLWNMGDSDTLYADSLFAHLYDSVGIYTVSLRAVSTHGCYDTTVYMKQAVQVHPTPTAAFYWELDPPAIHDPQAQFINLSLPDTIAFMWEIETADGGTDTTSAFAPIYSWGEPGDINTAGDHNVSLIAIWTHIIDDSTSLTCVDTSTQVVTIVNDFLQFPNLVTPNGDGNNDTWRIINLIEFGVYPVNELWIFNQWGIQVYHVKNIWREEDFWDPDRTNSPDGTYYYRFSARSLYGAVKRNGTIEVIRGE